MDGGGRRGWFPSNHVMRLPRQKKRTPKICSEEPSCPASSPFHGGKFLLGRIVAGGGQEGALGDVMYQQASWADDGTGSELKDLRKGVNYKEASWADENEYDDDKGDDGLGRDMLESVAEETGGSVRVVGGANMGTGARGGGLESWGVGEVSEWLASIDLDIYVAPLAERAVDGSALQR